MDPRCSLPSRQAAVFQSLYKAVHQVLLLPVTLSCIAVLLILLLPALSSAAVAYSYDARHRLTWAVYGNGVSIAYSYDGVGNRLSRTVVAPYRNYEDGEDGDTVGWDIFDNDPDGAAITNVADSDRQSRVIEFSGTGTANGYRLRNSDLSNWNDDENKVIEWSMRYSEVYRVYIAVMTSRGFRYIYYSPAEKDNLGDEKYIHHGLGAATMDGSWRTVTRDLAYDLKEAQPDNELEAVLGFLIRGSGRVDDITMRPALPQDLDSDGDGLADLAEINTYGTHPSHADSDGDGLADGDELTYWGDSWDGDIDSDGLINLLDPDSDGDGLSDGLELGQGTDPGDSASSPTVIVYEDAEDGLLSGWDVFDDDPAGAFIDNIYDGERDSRVIEFSGDGRTNGYRLRDDNGSWWEDDTYPAVQWSMRYSEDYRVYVAARTAQGFRYIYYSPVDTDGLGEGKYVHHGLGAETMDGAWHTITRDLAADLKEAQPDNELEAVLGILFRGSGRVDDIGTCALPPPGDQSP